MLERASGQFIIDGQVEDILGGINGAARIARISQTCRFSGQLEGESMAEFTAVLPREGDGCFHGFQRIAGTLGEREGSFVLSVSGEYSRGQPRGTWTIVPKSGSGDFVHIRGSGTFSLPNGKPGAYKLEFDLRKPRLKRAAVDNAADSVSEQESSEQPSSKAQVTRVDAVAQPQETQTRKRKAVPETPPTPLPKPKRARTSAPVEPVVAESDSAPEPPKTPRRTKSAPSTPVSLPVTDPALPRKRRAKAA